MNHDHRDGPDPAGASPGIEGMNAWRERILAAILSVGIPLGAVVYVPSVYLAVTTGLPGVAFIDTLMLAGAFLVWLRPAWPFRLRASILVGLVYVLGVWLLIDVGPISQIYLFAFSITAGLLLGTRAAIVTIAVNAATLFAVGYFAGAHFDSAFLPEAGGLAAWTVVSMNFLLVNALLSVPLAVVLGGLERSLHGQRTAVQSLERERARLSAANARLEEAVEQRARAEERLQRLGMAVEQASDVIIMTGPDGTPVYVNGAYEHLIGCPRETGLKRGDAILSVISLDGEDVQGISALLKDEAATERTVSVLRSGGKGVLQMRAAVSKFADAAGGPGGRVVILRDVSAETVLEQRLRQAQKLEAIGTLAGGIAHDFNNILSSILGHAELLRQRIDADRESAGYCDEIVTASARAKGLVGQILLFSRQRTAEPQTMSIREAVEEAMGILRPAIPSTVEIAAAYEAPAAAVYADPTELHQILMNLCTNAAQAMEEKGGFIGVTVSEFEADEAVAAMHTRLTAGRRYVRIAVSDTGHGMDARTRDRVFDPFFTTKEKGKGTGLGLATVHGIVTALDGDLSVYSEVGRGTTMCVYLPRADRAAALPASEGDEDEAWSGSGKRALVVDDEEAILNLCGRILSNKAFEVDRCGTMADALARVEAAPAGYDLVLTDFTMPRGTGVQLAAAIRTVRDDLPIVLMSGFNDSLSASDLAAAGVTTFVHKPFTQRELYRAVRKAMGM